MPRGPRATVLASKRMITLITPREDRRFKALARFHGKPLAAIVRELLERELLRAERAGARLPQK